MAIPLIIKEACINCDYEITSDRLESSLPCNKDISDEEAMILCKINSKTELIEKIYSILSKKGRLFRFEDIYALEKASYEFSRFFENLLDSRPWSIQITWFRRLFKGESFSMVAPTGVGKTTFIIISSIFFALRNKRVYIILPTTVLVKQVYDRFREFLDKLGVELKVIAYLPKNRKKAKEDILAGDFDVLITSNQFLSKNFEILSRVKFDMIFIDDVDAFFRSSKNIDRVLMLIGFTEEDIKIAYDLVRAKQLGNFRKIQELEKVVDKIRKKEHGSIILSSATGRIKGQRVKLYRELLGFTIGSSNPKIRNIIDTYIIPDKDEKEIVLDLIRTLNDGILVFVSRDKGIEYAHDLYNYLKENGIRVGISTSEERSKEDIISKFANGELNVLIGIAHFYGILVRGLDLPTRVKYVIFVGVPKMRINLTKQENNIQSILLLSNLIKDLLPEDEKREITQTLKAIQNQMKKLSAEAYRVLAQAFQEGTQLEGWLGNIQNNLKFISTWVSEKLKDSNILNKLESHPDVSIVKIGEDLYLQIPDIKTYIQASGRSSRLYAGGITKGLSIVIVDDEKLLRSLERKLKIYYD